VKKSFSVFNTLSHQHSNDLQLITFTLHTDKNNHQRNYCARHTFCQR